MDLATLLSTIGLGLVVAGISVWAILENRRLRAETTHPQIEVSLASHPDLPDLADLLIKNEGHGPAHHIRFELTDGVIPRVIGKEFPIHILSDQLYYLPPGDSMRFMLGKWNELGDKTFSVTTTYYTRDEDEGNKRRVKRSSNTMDPKQSKGVLRLDNTERQMQKAIIDLSKALIRGKVTITIKDHDREVEKDRQYLRQCQAESEQEAIEAELALETGYGNTVHDAYDLLDLVPNEDHGAPEVEPGAETVTVPPTGRRHSRRSFE